MKAPIAELGDVAEVSAGNPAPQDASLYIGGTHVFIRTSDVGRVRTGDIGDSADKLSNDGIQGMRKFRAGVTLLPKSGASTFNNYRVMTSCEAYVSSHLAIVDGHSGVLDDRFIYYFLQTIEAQDLLGESAYPSLNLSHIRSIAVPVPPIAEQQRIAGRLDQAQSLVDSFLSNLAAESGLTRQFRDRLTELRASQTNASKVVRLGDVLRVQNGFAFSAKHFSANGEVGLIRIRDLKNGEGTQTRFSGEYSSDYLVRAGDLLIGMDGEFKCYQWRGEPALLNQRVCRLIDFAEDVVPEYLLFVLNEHLKKIEDVTGYATVKHLSSKTIAEIELPLPSIDDQKRAAQKWSRAVEQINQLEESFDRQVQLAQSLRAEVIRSAIWGGA